MHSDIRIAIIGLGLIGGSMAFALKGYKNAEIVGCDTNAETRRLALKTKAVNHVYADASDAIAGSDIVIFCTYPEVIQKLICDNINSFKSGCIITDVCGIKTELTQKIAEILPESLDFVGGHPMAGKEIEGFENASSELFWMCGYIITPLKRSKPESVDIVREIAEYVGATRITVASPEEHDKVIAYTSDLMHISASALCLSYPKEMNRAYTAGAFRDCTRVARINPQLWSELFISNKDNVVFEIDRLIENISLLRSAISDSNKEKIEELLSIVCENKITMQGKEPSNENSKR